MGWEFLPSGIIVKISGFTVPADQPTGWSSPTSAGLKKPAVGTLGFIITERPQNHG